MGVMLKGNNIHFIIILINQLLVSLTHQSFVVTNRLIKLNCCKLVKRIN